MNDRIKDYFENLSDHFSNLLPTEVVGLYCQLLWMNYNTYNGNGIQISDISKYVNVSQDRVYNYVLLLSECGLVEFRKRKNAIYISKIDSRSKEDDILLLEKLCDKGIIPLHRKQGIIDLLNVVEVKKIAKKKAESSPQIFDFESQSNSTKINYFNLVNYYYGLLSDTFGGSYKSHNVYVESAMLKNVMTSNSDSAEKTKKMFEYIIKKSRSSGEFERVSSMGLYSRIRNKVHHELFEKNGGIDSPIISPVRIDEAQKMNNIRSLYLYYIKDGMDRDSAISELTKTFGGETINRFLEGDYAKQVSAHQGKV